MSVVSKLSPRVSSRAVSLGGDASHLKLWRASPGRDRNRRKRCQNRL